MGARFPAPPGRRETASGQLRVWATSLHANRALLEADIANLEAARDRCSPLAVFMTAAAPGLITHMTANQHYASHEEYVGALADAMKAEYDAIHAAGFVLQFDCPDLASWGRTTYPYPGATFEDWRRVARQNVEATQRSDAGHPARGYEDACVLGELRRAAYPRRRDRYATSSTYSYTRDPPGSRSEHPTRAMSMSGPFSRMSSCLRVKS